MVANASKTQVNKKIIKELKSMEKKMTKKEMFTLIATLNASNTEIVDFCNHEIELLERKKSQGNAKANEKMDKQVALVYSVLESSNTVMTVSEIIASGSLDELANENGVVSTQKVSAILKKLVDSGKVVKFTEKKKTYFRIKAE